MPILHCGVLHESNLKFTRVYRVGNCNPSNHTTSWNSYAQVSIIPISCSDCGPPLLSLWKKQDMRKYIILNKHVSKNSYQFCHLYVYFTLQWTNSDHIKYVTKYLQRQSISIFLKVGELLPIYIRKGIACDVSNERADVKGVSIFLNWNVPFLEGSKATSS